MIDFLTQSKFSFCLKSEIRLRSNRARISNIKKISNNNYKYKQAWEWTTALAHHLPKYWNIYQPSCVPKKAETQRRRHGACVEHLPASPVMHASRGRGLLILCGFFNCTLLHTNHRHNKQKRFAQYWFNMGPDCNAGIAINQLWVNISTN